MEIPTPDWSKFTCKVTRRVECVEKWRQFSRSSEIVNKQAKIMSASLKRMSDMGAKNGEGMLEVLADDMGRYGLLTYWTSAFGLGPIQLTSDL